MPSTRWRLSACAETSSATARQAGDDAQLAEDRVEQIDDAGLAVGAGDAEQRRGVLVGAVDPRGDGAERGSRIGRDDDRQTGVGGELRAGLVGEHGDGARFGRGRGEARSVHVLAWHADVEVARLDRRAREGGAGDLDGVEITSHVQPELRDQLGERAGDGMLGAQRGGRRSCHGAHFQ